MYSLFSAPLKKKKTSVRCLGLIWLGLIFANTCRTLDSGSSIKLVSFNVNGLGDFDKRSNFITHVNTLNADLVVFVDTRLNEIKSRLLQNEADAFHWSFANGIVGNGAISRGVAIGIRKSSMIIAGESTVITEGNVLKTQFKFEGHEFIVYGIYGPSDGDRPSFYESVFNDCATTPERYKICAGDFNVPLNFRLDTFNCNTDSRKRARERILSKMEMIGLKDIYRAKNGNKELYTWHNANGTKRSRLDYFLVTENLVPVVKKADKGNFFLSDHRNIYMILDFSGIKSGKTRWKYTNSMRQNAVLRDIINTEIYECHFRYLKQPNPCISRQEFLRTPPANLHTYEYEISWGDLLNVVLNDVRNVIISYESRQRLMNRHEVKDLQDEMARIEDDIQGDLDRLQVLKNRYEEIINIKTVRNLTNRQDSFKIDGERPSSFFLNLETNRVSEKYIPRLKNGDGWITDQGQIEDNIRTFYKDLYENKDDLRTGLSIEDYIGVEGRDIAPKLEAGTAESIDGKITSSEIWDILKKTNDNSAPGLTGMGYSFFKDYWPMFGNLLERTFNESYSNEKLPDFMSRGVISLLPKGDKDRTLLKNWRPITLLECAYKLLSGCLAARLNSVINKLVDPVQKGFVPNRNIAENTRTFYDILDYAKKNNKGGAAIVLDYEKAFDTLSHTYFDEVLTFFGFSSNFRKWIRVCLSNFYASTSHANNISEQFGVNRGARQGDPLSPPMFALAIEIFSIKIRSSPEAVPYDMGGILIKLLLYADDSIVLTTQNENSVRFILNAVQEFFGVSGLKIQLSKSNLFNFGVDGPDLCPEIVIERKKKITYLGIQFDNMLEFMDENITKKIKEITDTGKKWLYRQISPLGRSTVAKAILLPKVCHILSVVPVHQKVIDQLQRKIFEFIWGGERKHPSFARNDSQVSTYEGGLNMPDINASLKSYQISWLRRAINNRERNAWRLWLDKLLHEACGKTLELLLLAGNKRWQMAANKMENGFWKEALKSYNKLVPAVIEKEPLRITTMSIWDSTLFRNNNRFLNPSCRRYEAFSSKFSTVMELLDENGSIMQYETANAKFGPNFPGEILTAVANKMNSLQLPSLPRIPPGMFGPLFVPFSYATLNKYEKGCSYWNRFLKRRKNNSIKDFERKQANMLGLNLDEERWKQIYWMVSKIQYGNDIKWFIHQILRGSLTTNTRLVKMKIRNCALCTFCGQSDETISHLFWDCGIVSQFLTEIKDEMDRICPFFDIGFGRANTYGKEVFLLGDNRRDSGMAPNYFYNITKKFIWNVRCREGQLAVGAFFSFIRKRLQIDRPLARRYDNLAFIGLAATRLGIG